MCGLTQTVRADDEGGWERGYVGGRYVPLPNTEGGPANEEVNQVASEDRAATKFNLLRVIAQNLGRPAGGSDMDQVQRIIDRVGRGD